MAEAMEIRETSLGDPGPLGLAAFAATTFLLCAANAGIMDASVKTVFVPVALIYGGLVQILVGMKEMKKNNTFGLVAFTTYGAFWIALATLVLFEVTGVLEHPAAGHAHAWLLLAFTIFTFYMWIGTFKLNNALLFTFTTLEIAFILLTLSNFGIMGHELGGYFGLAAAAGAWYTSAAGVLNPLFGRTVLPVGPRK
ncbi:MAG: acetate uptake transporter [Desulfitobacteriaceae bacterium]|nr:acetate uptake transporter [Desulfitobacteriaceae bacterium]MDD4346238.1 acetate uptake transporter [Desulfitobacteriaceae bacterium]MDD4401629.1 acetate uptake transporter [Desulfitobacteriaceae bacterium]